MPTRVRLGTPAGRWTVAASVLGSGAAFLEMTVVNVALPSIGRDFGLGLDGLQWVVNGYLLTLSALMLLGGALGDAYRRRRVFVLGLVGFAVASLGAAAAPTVGLLVAARLVQGMAGALLVPNSLALLETCFVEEDRGAAIGQWAGWSAVSTALGPLAGGWLAGYSWRYVFAVVAPFALVAAFIATRRVPDADRPGEGGVDYRGAVVIALGLAGIIHALITGPEAGWGRPDVWLAGGAGLILTATFFRLEQGARHPLLPLDILRIPQFAGANVTTLFVYAALSGMFFMLMLQLQNVLGYGALAAGASLLPVNVLMVTLSPVAGRIGQRVGPRWPIAAGALVAGAGMLLITRVQPGAAYVTGILPGVVVFGLGLASLVAPLTAAVLAAVDDERAGVASAVNNAAARLAGLLATAALPLAAGIGGLQNLSGPAFADGFVHAMLIGAGLCATGAVVAILTIRK